MSRTSLFQGEFDERAIAAFAARLALALKPGDCLALYGDLGAGKSSFARALIKALADAREVPSPTFTLVQHYDTPQGPLHHFDLYRLRGTGDIFELGWEEAVSGITLIEWPERLGALLPSDALAIRLDFPQHPAARILTLEGNAAWATRLALRKD